MITRLLFGQHPRHCTAGIVQFDMLHFHAVLRLQLLCHPVDIAIGACIATPGVPVNGLAFGFR
ncbi:hypothetical protein HORIV_07840 [Vreelandella olivaria]|uniref:Uncharacterized protein n=1 Tax=Vreelandella olivaria TaxID=390919 RepID=A0ABM7GDD1_9GAMM|nr:hypothetical protein HORIV_07840 [Halomonas olivaria]